MSGQSFPKDLDRAIKRLRNSKSIFEKTELSDAYREVLRRYRMADAAGAGADDDWLSLVEDALMYLGGQSDRLSPPLACYDHERFGPFLGISNEGSKAPVIADAAGRTPKAKALGKRKTPLALGMGVDAERLSSVGEVPAGPTDFSTIWAACVDRALMTTNVGSRVNLRLYRPATVLRMAGQQDEQTIAKIECKIDQAFKPFAEAPGAPRPLIVYIQFDTIADDAVPDSLGILRKLVEHVGASTGLDPKLHTLGLSIATGPGESGCDEARRAVDLAKQAGVSDVIINGIMTDPAEAAISLPGLLNFFAAPEVDTLLRYAAAAGVRIGTPNRIDTDAVAHEIWSALSTARAMGLNLGKYGLFPLSLEESDYVIGRIQQWFPDWSAAPVFYVDQGLISRDQVYQRSNIEEGVATWLRMVAARGVRIVLIDTVDKAAGLKILKVDGDDKGLLTLEEIGRLTELGRALGVNTMWAGGLSAEQAQALARLGVFGIYVTSAVSEAVPVFGLYERDPALPSVKSPTLDGVVRTKTLIEAGFLAGQRKSPRVNGNDDLDRLLKQVDDLGSDVAKLTEVLPAAWAAWWRTFKGQSA